MNREELKEKLSNLESEFDGLCEKQRDALEKLNDSVCNAKEFDKWVEEIRINNEEMAKNRDDFFNTLNNNKNLLPIELTR